MTTPIHERPGDLLSELIRFETVNPPGNERACIEYIDGLLTEAGLATETLALEPERPNLLARLPGGDAPPLLLQGHVDVVPTDGQEWDEPPFSGTREDGFVWGRGALDMKGGVAMMVTAMLRAAEEGVEPAGDVLLVVLSDEEMGGDVGAKYLVENHPERFADVEYAIGEFGGFPLRIDGTEFYPIQVAEKQVCWLEATVTGRGGHASRPQRDGTMHALGELLTRLTEQRLPVRITPPAREFVEALAAEAEPERAEQLRGLLDPDRTDDILDELGPLAERLDPILHNTVSPTVVDGGGKVNVHPAEVELKLDGRLLPDVTPEEFLEEIREVVGDVEGVEFEVVQFDGGESNPVDMGLFDLLSDALTENHPEAVPVPFLLTGATDGRFFEQLGIQPYGYTPLKLPPSFEFEALVHAANERVPVEAVEFGTDTLSTVIREYGST
ncbi:peptidase M20 [Halorubrum sp. 48-1-W]|uniref:M20/M25/M40 family metallo-hydrolase n=1 Tax=Halorubrum sp. 48-1-W TaxID=2249761 RepID=UPI000DCD5007|nr:M20/M25/M40 family metallo-hydrolase [Halorubrum sp. 48-1-W]RAW45789.1 peptidase M20 [Halorubrum sp. 48-1-W]